MIVHIMVGFKNYTENFINFVQDNFNVLDHMFIITKNVANISGKNVIDTTDMGLVNKIRTVDRELFKAEKIVLHGLFDDFWLYYFTLRKKLIRKIMWFIWGGDLYYYKFRPPIIRSEINEFLRRGIFKRMDHIITFNTGNFKVFKEVYDSKAILHPAFYPFKLRYKDLDKFISDHQDDPTTRIIAGNSAAENNHHKSMLDILSPFSKEDVEIFMPLSYGVNREYVESVVEHGKDIFGEKFKPMLDHMEEEQYYQFLSTIDIAVYYQDRPQGMGNILPLIYMGKKVFIKSDIPSWLLFEDIGVRVFDSYTIEGSSFHELKTIMGDDVSDNSVRINKNFSREICVQKWSDIFARNL